MASINCISLTVLFCSLLFINAQTASPKLTLSSPIYYVNESILISCDSGISSGLASVDVKIEKVEVLYAITCAIADGKWEAVKQGISTDNCETLPSSGDINLVITTQLTERMRSSTLTCTIKYIDGVDIKSKSDTIALAFSDSYIAPTRLEFEKFEFDDNMPVLNKKIRAHCISYGGYPASELIYEVRNKSNAVVYSTTEVKDGAAEFTIDHPLKNGFKVTCRDKVHSKGKIYHTRQNCRGTGSEVCMPWFLEIPSDVQLSQKPSLNPNYSNLLNCAVNGYPTDKITYSWTSGGKVLPSVTGGTYNLNADVGKKGTKENLTCTASLDKYGDETITWEINWSIKATTTTAPTYPATSFTSTAIGTGVGISTLVVIIIVVLGIILHKKKKDFTTMSRLKGSIHRRQLTDSPNQQPTINRSDGLYDEVTNSPNQYEYLDLQRVPEGCSSHDYQAVIFYENISSLDEAY